MEFLSLRPDRDGGATVVVSFKAGKLEAKKNDSGKFLMTPDTRKGEINIVRGRSDHRVKFQWRDLTTNTITDVFHGLPGTMEFKKMDTGRANDRVYLLEVKDTGRRLFYWMQDKDETQDERMLEAVNAYLRPSSSTGPHTGPPRINFTSLIRSLEREGPSESISAEATTQIQLQSALENIGFPKNGQSKRKKNGSKRSGMGLTKLSKSRVSLSDVLHPYNVLDTGVFDDSEVAATLSSLLPDVPMDDPAKELFESLRSPSFQQTLESLTLAIESDDFFTVMENFDLTVDGPEATAALSKGDRVLALLHAIIDDIQKTKSAGSEESKSTAN